MDLEIEYLLFKQINKPQNHILTKIINVYDNRYRINLYCEHQEDNLIKNKICASYFCHYNKNNLTIVSSGITI